MDRSSPDPTPAPSPFSRLVRLLPTLLAAATTAVAALAVFPAAPATGALIAALAWASALASYWAARASTPEPAAASPRLPVLIDEETSLGNARHLTEVLHREIARSARHGAPLTLALLEVEVAGVRDGGPPPRSPAPFVARALVNSVRESDAVHRLDERRFAMVLTECEGHGANALIERVRTQLSSAPYARNSDGSGLYARTWAAALPWTGQFGDEQQYLAAALEALLAARGDYRAAASLFEGPPVRPQKIA